ncbi:MAG: type II toxin-antitoxin system VapC family toxin [Gammaproteobacteria bacterium]|nr:type II toxin-antitoxin system VapC family toxin [Gammaproteobacteria bacterium]
MAFVLDCSVTMAWIFPDEATEATNQLRGSLVGGRAFAPSLWPVEVGNVLLTATRRQRIRVSEWPQIQASLAALPIETDAVSPSRVWGKSLELAQTHQLSVYDAMYLELATRLQLPLATLDGALRTAAQSLGLAAPPAPLHAATK